MSNSQLYLLYSCILKSTKQVHINNKNMHEFVLLVKGLQGIIHIDENKNSKVNQEMLQMTEIHE